MKLDVIRTAEAPGAIGPYSQAVRVGDMVFLSGQIALDPATGRLVEGDIVSQSHRCMRNLGAVLKAGGLDFTAVVRTTIFLIDLADFELVNGVYAEYFRESPPARSTVQVAALPRGSRIEIDAIAWAGEA